MNGFGLTNDCLDAIDAWFDHADQAEWEDAQDEDEDEDDGSLPLGLDALGDMAL
jgi:hypothetical protein